jgi:hypothetical protein
MDNQLKTITGLTVFIIIGLCCAGGIIAGPVFAPYVPDLPARAAATPRPTFTLIPTRTPTATPTPWPTPGRLIFPTIDPADLPTLTPVPPPQPTRVAPANDDQRFVGQGSTVLRFRLNEAGAVRFVYSHTGQSNFIVRLLDEGGNYAGGIANEIGNADGEVIEGIPAGDYFLEVEADGQWIINVITN